MEIGFEYQQNEFLPKIDKFQSSKNCRKLFFSLYNLSVDKKFEIKANCKIDLFENFYNKISNDLNLNILNKKNNKKIKNFCINDTIFINNFLSKIDKPILKYIKTPYQKLNTKTFKLDTSNLIAKIFDNEKIYFKENIEKLFINYVLEKMKIKNKSNIYKNNNAIHIQNFHNHTKVYPMWKIVNSKDIDNILNDIYKAIDEIKYTSLNQLYLVYPKNSDFEKHIIVNTDLNDKRLKLIPFSFRRELKN